MLYYYIFIFLILGGIAYILQSLHNSGLLNVSEVVSLLVAEIPLGIGLWWVLGERQRNRFSDALDGIELGEKYEHLTVHYWILGWRVFNKAFSVVENTNTHIAYDCPDFIDELAAKGIIHRIRHKNEPEMRSYLAGHGVTLVDEREATFRELRA